MPGKCWGCGGFTPYKDVNFCNACMGQRVELSKEDKNTLAAVRLSNARALIDMTLNTVGDAVDFETVNEIVDLANQALNFVEVPKDE
jgi:hypothetical protein